MATNGEVVTNGVRKARPRLALARSCSENYEINEVEIPGTPKTPRTSTTPGIWNNNYQ